ncbi:MAG TPA: GMP synthase [Gammaproteobacteria bacterium]|nr:GMP synthase [Gammaproteobacteria bacterium]
MRIHTIIHAPFEKPGVIENWAINNGHSLSSTHIYQGEILPDVSTIDFLIIMGGPQSPTELDQYPYLRDEIILTKQAIDQGKVILGICLGAQIISESLGAKTERSPNKEIGVYPVYLTKDGEVDSIFKKFPQMFDVMHWHNDMPGIPEGAVLLAYSEGCPRQVIRYSDRAYGLQCHMEMTTDLIKGMIEHCEIDLKPGKYVQQNETLLKNNISEINSKMFFILDCLESVFTKKSINENIV